MIFKPAPVIMMMPAGYFDPVVPPQDGYSWGSVCGRPKPRGFASTKLVVGRQALTTRANDAAPGRGVSAYQSFRVGATGCWETRSQAPIGFRWDRTVISRNRISRAPASSKRGSCVQIGHACSNTWKVNLTSVCLRGVQPVPRPEVRWQRCAACLHFEKRWLASTQKS